MINTDLLPVINTYIVKLRESENISFYKGKITDQEIFGQISGNTGNEYFPFLIILSISGIIYLQKAWKRHKKESKITPVNLDQ